MLESPTTGVGSQSSQIRQTNASFPVSEACFAAREQVYLTPVDFGSPPNVSGRNKNFYNNDNNNNNSYFSPKTPTRTVNRKQFFERKFTL